MKFATLVAASTLALVLTACGGSDDTAQSATSVDKAPMEPTNGDKMEHAEHAPGGTGTPAGSSMGHGTGVIKALGRDGDSLLIDHGPIEGIGMSAMTMSFDIQGDVDLSGFAEGDSVAFMVKKGRDKAYRIAALCNTGADGADCLAGMMVH